MTTDVAERCHSSASRCPSRLNILCASLQSAGECMPTGCVEWRQRVRETCGLVAPPAGGACRWARASPGCLLLCGLPVPVLCVAVACAGWLSGSSSSSRVAAPADRRRPASLTAAAVLSPCPCPPHGSGHLKSLVIQTLQVSACVVVVWRGGMQGLGRDGGSWVVPLACWCLLPRVCCFATVGAPRACSSFCRGREWRWMNGSSSSSWVGGAADRRRRRR